MPDFKTMPWLTLATPQSQQNAELAFLEELQKLQQKQGQPTSIPANIPLPLSTAGPPLPPQAPQVAREGPVRPPAQSAPKKRNAPLKAETALNLMAINPEAPAAASTTAQDPTRSETSAFADQMAGLKDLEQQIQEYRNQPTQLDLTPLMALSDSWSGSKLAQAYRAPESAQEKMQRLVGLQNQLQQRRAELTRPELAAFKAQNDFLRKSWENEQRDRRLERTIEGRMGNWQERADRQTHKDLVKSVKNDKTIVQRLNSFDNLSNAEVLLTHGKKLTPEQIHDFQQAVRTNLGIKGTSTVHERDLTMYNNLEMNIAKIKQFLNGKPQDLAKNQAPLVEHLKDLARVEKDSIRSVVQKRLDALTEGHEDIYERHPDLREHFGRTVQGVLKQFGNPPAAQGAAPVQANAAPESSGVQATPVKKEETLEEMRERLKRLKTGQ
jgi:hypothetical protein